MNKSIIKICTLILIILSIFILEKSYAYSNQLALKFGAGTSVTTFDNSYADDQTFSIGINSHFGYRLNNLELNLSSYVNIGRADLDFKSRNREVDGEGTLKTSSFGPVLKYFMPLKPVRFMVPYLHEVKTDWRTYLGGGPTWAQQTLKLTQFEVKEGEYDANYKINYTSRGFMLVAGLEQISLSKKEHPIFVELCYNFLKAKRVTVVKVTEDFLETNAISEERLGHNVTTHIIMISMGFTAF